MFAESIASELGIPREVITPRMRREWRDRFTLPLAWAASTETRRDTNLGDALSAVIVQAIAGRRVRHAHFDEDCERLVAVGTIGQWQRNGKVHLWGTGVDPVRNAVGSSIERYIRPPSTDFNVHAVRGPLSAAALQTAGIEAPKIYGDPVWFLPRIFARAPVQTAELGVVVHVTELERHAADATVRAELLRYERPATLAKSIRIINTYAPATLGGLRDKVAEITSCRRILSTSLHGLVIAETYGIPCAWFAPFGGGPRLSGLDVNEERSEKEAVDPRIRDFYAGVGREDLLAYCQEREEKTDWDAVVRFIDASWRPLAWDGRALFRAFPLPVAVRFSQARWPLDEESFSSVRL